MSKYIHSKMDLYLKSDAKKIKKHNKNLKQSAILNTLSQILGWRHFNELQKNITKINNPTLINKIFKNNEIVNIESYSYRELSHIQSEYFNNVKELFPNPYIVKSGIVPEEHIKYQGKYDLYEILKGLFYNHRNIRKKLIKSGNGDELKISFLNKTSSIKLSNEEIEQMIHLSIEHSHSNNLYGESMWIGRSCMAIESMLKALKSTDEYDWQEKIASFFSFEELYNFWKKLPSSKDKTGLTNYILNMPGFVEGQTIPSTASEQHGYVMMFFNIFNEPYFKINNKTKNIYKLNDLKKSNKNIVIEYKENGNIDGSLKILKLLLNHSFNDLENDINNFKNINGGLNE